MLNRFTLTVAGLTSAAALVWLTATPSLTPRFVGPDAEFQTISAGIAALNCGEELRIAPGVYEEHLNLRRLACTADNSVAIVADGGDVIVRGMRRETDWLRVNDVFVRQMFQTVDGGQIHEPDLFDPSNVFQRMPDGSFHALGYEGDGVQDVRDGRWSFDRVTRLLRVNPFSDADVSTIFVPFVSQLVALGAPAAHIRIQGITFEGARSAIINGVSPGAPMPGLQFVGIRARYAAHYIMRLNGAPGLRVYGSVFTDAARGFSGSNVAGSAGGYALRIFGAHGCEITQNVLGHLGTCAYCDAPWRPRDSFTTPPAFGNGFSLKQTDGCDVRENIFLDIPQQASFQNDVSRNVMFAQNFIERAGPVRVGTQTPIPGFCCSSEVEIIGNNFFNQPLGIAVADEPRDPAQDFYVRIAENTFSDVLTPMSLPSPLPLDIILGTNETPTTTSTSVPSTTTTSSLATTTSTAQPTTTVTSSTSTTTVTTSTSTTTTITTSTSLPPTTTSTSTTITTTTLAPSTTTTSTIPLDCRPFDSPCWIHRQCCSGFCQWKFQNGRLRPECRVRK